MLVFPKLESIKDGSQLTSSMVYRGLSDCRREIDSLAKSASFSSPVVFHFGQISTDSHQSFNPGPSLGSFTITEVSVSPGDASAPDVTFDVVVDGVRMKVDTAFATFKNELAKFSKSYAAGASIDISIENISAITDVTLTLMVEHHHSSTLSPSKFKVPGKRFCLMGAPLAKAFSDMASDVDDVLILSKSPRTQVFTVHPGTNLIPASKNKIYIPSTGGTLHSFVVSIVRGSGLVRVELSSGPAVNVSGGAGTVKSARITADMAIPAFGSPEQYFKISTFAGSSLQRLTIEAEIS